MICKVEYVGPMNIIVSEKEGCTFAINVKQSLRHDLILSPSHGCMPASEASGEMKHFGIGRCDKEHSNYQ